MRAVRTSSVTGAVLVVAGSAVLIVREGPPGLMLLAVVAVVVGLVLLVVGVMRSASTTPLIVLGALLQLGGGAWLLGDPLREPVLVGVALALSALGFWLLLTGVIAAGVKLALRESAAPGAQNGLRTPGPS